MRPVVRAPPYPLAFTHSLIVLASNCWLAARLQYRLAWRLLGERLRLFRNAGRPRTMATLIRAGDIIMRMARTSEVGYSSPYQTPGYLGNPTVAHVLAYRYFPELPEFSPLIGAGSFHPPGIIQGIATGDAEGCSSLGVPIGKPFHAVHPTTRTFCTRFGQVVRISLYRGMGSGPPSIPGTCTAKHAPRACPGCTPAG